MASNLSLDDIKNEQVDLENIPVEEVFQQLKCSKEGLTTEEGQKRLQIFGPNKLEEKIDNKFLKFLGFMWNPLSWVMESAAIMAIVLANGGGKPPDWPDFVGITVLLIINSTISFIEENSAGNAAAALMANLAPKTKILRDGKWSEEDASILVPGDLISIKLGDIVPADARLLEGDPLKVDQAALTGESLPATKFPGAEVFSGSTVKQGEIEAVVIATGVHTFFGKAAHLVDSTNNVGHFQKVLTAIGNFCICSIAVGMVIEIVVMYPIQRRKYRDGIDNLLVLLIGGIPIAMPTVLSVTMAIGSHELAQQVFAKDADKDTVMLLGARAKVENQDAIDTCARKSRHKRFISCLSAVERRTAPATISMTKETGTGLAKELPSKLLNFVISREKSGRRRSNHGDHANRGLRSLGLARQTVPEKTKESETAWEFETARRLGMGTNMYPSSALLGITRMQPLLQFLSMSSLKRQMVLLESSQHSEADIGIAVDDATDAARSASDIVLTEPGLSVIVSAVLTSRAIFQRDRVKPSPLPDSWKLNDLQPLGVVLGTYHDMLFVVFFYLAADTDFFSEHFHVRSLRESPSELTAALYLQVATVPACLTDWEFARIKGIGWG
ncbi:hypothetical protein HAX54_020221 [Datura stramonium]|uniref:Cation-transporting P-type ATPase N-terminal domain-containing protein n=1 Tax=Datura stramonium TaxID=4076 RepID=A0ABS8URG7_DATST|nr:hypothetical protein [Datura stramonium]